MTQIETAMREAGVDLPTAKERVWNVIKEHMPNGVSTRTIVKRLSALPTQTVYTALFQLNARAMVYRTKGAPKGFRKGESVYFTDMEKFQLLPLPVASIAPKHQKAMGFSSPIEKKPVLPPPVEVKTFIDIEHLTIAEAKDLWRRLSKLFAN